MIVEMYQDGILSDVREVEPEQWREFMYGLEAGRRQFGALLDAGMSREAANAEMSRRIEAGLL